MNALERERDESRARPRAVATEPDLLSRLIARTAAANTGGTRWNARFLRLLCCSHTLRGSSGSFVLLVSACIPIMKNAVAASAISHQPDSGIENSIFPPLLDHIAAVRPVSDATPLCRRTVRLRLAFGGDGKSRRR
ncbi:hypothetical protein [Streptomyces macrosporus]|uniref:hypothetical protein n=1 Tax=Streptomyces macrosporus TaxID=44032 RepID=UPI0031DEA661